MAGSQTIRSNYYSVFSVDGKIRIAIINAPGTFHDSTVSDYGLYEQLKLLYNQYSAKIVVDSAFKIGDADYLVQSSQEDPHKPELIILNCEATLIC